MHMYVGLFGHSVVDFQAFRFFFMFLMFIALGTGIHCLYGSVFFSDILLTYSAL